MDNVGIVVTCRVKSSRIHEKALQRIRGKRAIEILLDHVIQDRFPVVLAIPKSKDCDILETIAFDKGVECFRGDDDSPLHRLYNCAEYFGFDYVARVTADDILIDMSMLYDQIKFALKGYKDSKTRKVIPHDYVYCWKCPEGTAAEVIRTKVLGEVVRDVGEKPVEFISYYIKGKYRTIEYYPRPEYQFTYRLTMDYPEDLMLLRILFASLHRDFGTLDALNFLHQHKYFLQINKQPSVTLYTCNYNTGKYIVDTMKSIYAQDYEDFEYIIIDDCSTDDSMNIIMDYYSSLPNHLQEKTKIFRNSENMGLTDCCNKVLETARGDYIMRVDSDDILEPHAISIMVERMRLESYQAVLSQFHYIDDKDEIIDIEKNNMYHPACCLLNTWTVNEIKYKSGIKYLDGVPFFEEFDKRYSMGFIEKPLWNYRQHEEQKTAQADHPSNLI